MRTELYVLAYGIAEWLIRWKACLVKGLKVEQVTEALAEELAVGGPADAVSQVLLVDVQDRAGLAGLAELQLACLTG